MRKTLQGPQALQENMFIDTSTPSAFALFGKNWMPHTNNTASFGDSVVRTQMSPSSGSNMSDIRSGRGGDILPPTNKIFVFQRNASKKATTPSVTSTRRKFSRESNRRHKKVLLDLIGRPASSELNNEHQLTAASQKLVLEAQDAQVFAQNQNSLGELRRVPVQQQQQTQVPPSSETPDSHQLTIAMAQAAAKPATAGSGSRITASVSNMLRDIKHAQQQAKMTNQRVYLGGPGRQNRIEGVQQLQKSDSFGPLVFSDPNSTTTSNNLQGGRSTMAGNWAIQANRLGFEPRLTQFNFTPIRQSRLSIIEQIKSGESLAGEGAVADIEPKQHQHEKQIGSNHDLSEFSSFMQGKDKSEANRQLDQRRCTQPETTKLLQVAQHKRAQSSINDRSQPNYTSMMDPVLGPLNSWKRGGPAALSPYNSKNNVDIDNQVEEENDVQGIDAGEEATTAHVMARPTSTSSRGAVNDLGYRSVGAGSFTAAGSQLGTSQFGASQLRATTYSMMSDKAKTQVFSKPHIAFMQKRARHKPRAVATGESAVWGPIFPQPDDLTQMQPFVPGPQPDFLSMQRYRKRQIKTNRGFEMSYQPNRPLTKQRNTNTQPCDQSYIARKMDKLDRYVEKHSIKVYEEQMKQRQQSVSQRRTQQTRKVNKVSGKVVRAPGRVNCADLNDGMNHLTQTLIEITHKNKPKKTILVKVSSNDALPSRSELATKHDEEELNQIMPESIEKNHASGDMTMHLISQNGAVTSSKDVSLLDEYAHLRETERHQPVSMHDQPVDVASFNDIEQSGPLEKSPSAESHIFSASPTSQKMQQQQKPKLMLQGQHQKLMQGGTMIDEQRDLLKQVRLQRNQRSNRQTSYLRPTKGSSSIGNPAALFRKPRQVVRQKANSNQLNLQSGRLQYMLSSSAVPLNLLSPERQDNMPKETLVSSLNNQEGTQKNTEFSSMMVPFLAFNQDRQALGGGKGIVNLEKFHLILEEMQKRKGSGAPALYSSEEKQHQQMQVQSSDLFSEAGEGIDKMMNLELIDAETAKNSAEHFN